MYRPGVQTSDIRSMASRVASVSVTAAKRGKPRPKKRKRAAPRRDVADSLETVSEDILSSGPEIACRVELSISASFEGVAAKANLVRKLKSSLLSAVKEAMTDVARSMNLKSNGVTVQPLRLECDVNDA
jgi:hypothetical protein